MSRIGKIPVVVPKEVKINVDGKFVKVEGPKGKLVLDVPLGVNVEFKDDQLAVSRESNVKQYRASHGTVRALLSNMVVGVKDGHKKELEIQGIGFRAKLEGKKIVMSLGFSHPVEFEIPESVKVAVPNQTSITVEGPDKESVGLIASKIRALKPAEPYKGKGIRYLGENVRRKQGKSVTK